MKMYLWFHVGRFCIEAQAPKVTWVDVPVARRLGTTWLWWERRDAMFRIGSPWAALKIGWQ